MKTRKYNSKVLFYFNQIAKYYDTKITASSKGLKYIDKIEVDSILNIFPVNSQNKILDVGTGTGRFIEKIANEGLTILALDISPEMLEIAKKKIDRINTNYVYFVIASADHIPTKNETFDKIIDKDGIAKAGSGIIDFLGKKSKDDGPTYGAKILSAGLPAVLSYMAALQDAKKPGPQDASEYMSAVDTAYGGQLAPPPKGHPAVVSLLNGGNPFNS